MIQQTHILDSLPGLCYWKDTEFAYVGCNKATVRATGIHSKEDIIGLTDDDLPWAEETPNYRSQDRYVLAGHHLSVIERIHLKGARDCFALTRKSPIYDDNKRITGLFGQAFILFDTRLVERLDKLYLNDCTLFDGVEMRNYQIMDEYPQLTSRETDCLFYFLRNYSAKVIAEKLSISPRTVEQHITSIKDKYNCHTRVDLLAFCFEKGLHRIIIQSFLD